MGYAGGSTENPTYPAISDHTETFQVDFDPTRTSFEKLLQVFWKSHDPRDRSGSTQYRNVVFYADDAQKTAIDTSVKELEARLGAPVRTAVLPLRTFTLAEDYHQKHRLRGTPTVLSELEKRYPSLEGLLAAPVVTKVNAWLAGYGNRDEADRLLPHTGLSEETQATIRSRLR